jgi:hypothetical protein
MVEGCKIRYVYFLAIFLKTALRIQNKETFLQNFLLKKKHEMISAPVFKDSNYIFSNYGLTLFKNMLLYRKIDLFLESCTGYKQRRMD